MEMGPLQSAMGGTLSSYDLNVEVACFMIEGNLLPQWPQIFASVLSIMFIGMRMIPQMWLRSTFKVRHQVVHEALQWLKENNVKYYGHMKLCMENLSELPVDDVPSEVVGLVQHSNDIGILEEENGGYLPSHDDPIAGKVPLREIRG